MPKPALYPLGAMQCIAIIKPTQKTPLYGWFFCVSNQWVCCCKTTCIKKRLNEFQNRIFLYVCSGLTKTNPT